MRTSGYGNDSLMIFIPAGVLVAVGVMLFGGPAEALEAINALMGETARAAMSAISALLS